MDMQAIRKRARAGVPAAAAVETTTIPAAEHMEHLDHTEHMEHVETKVPARLREPTPMPSSAKKPVDPLEDFLFEFDLAGAPVPALPIVEGQRHLAFTLGTESYAVDIMDVREILKLYAVTPVPRSPPCVLGVISKRGVVMPVYDLAALAGLRPMSTERHPHHRVLVAGQGDRICGLRVDAIEGVIELGANLEPIPASVVGRSAEMLRGLGRNDDRMAIVIDIARVLAMVGGNKA